VTLRLYDTATRAVREFVPRVPGQVGIYLCGLTVQAGPHIGHLRSAVNGDVLRRWLAHRGYEVTFIRNLTDIDDKVLARAARAGRPFWALAYANERLLAADFAAIGVLAPTYEPRATGHIPEIHELIKILIERGHAYPADGDVYFDVRSWPGYGALSGQRPDSMEPAADGPVRAKRDPRDFALWKGQKPGEPAWSSPWGPGRPGWHIECSAMAWRYLGTAFDIHGGGLDLTFAHHENELAQSRAAGHEFAGLWFHNGLLRLADEKMSQSLGNVITLGSLAAAGVRPVELRYYLTAAHYRSQVDYSEASLKESASAYQKIENFVQRAADTTVSATPAVPDAFAEAMDDDLNTSRALGVVHDTVRAGNAALAAGDRSAAADSLSLVRGALGALGLDPLDPQWIDDRQGDLRLAVDGLVQLALGQRTAARERKDWVAADAIRDQLKAAGVAVEDTPTGPRWTLEVQLDGR
jgi:cysteinyl-tRNA synthetase